MGYWHFRVTRNSELYIDEEEIGNLLKAVENELHNRRKGDAVRLEVEQRLSRRDLRNALLETLKLTEDDLVPHRRPAESDAADGDLLRAITRRNCATRRSSRPSRRRCATSRICSPPSASATFCCIIPTKTFDSVVDFLEQAADDPHVLAIKQTLYRTGGDPRIIGALMNAVNNGKQVTAVVELRARFDEANNIQWARQLEEAGVHVVYGLVGYKIHAQDVPGRAAREARASAATFIWPPGNYNPTTARLYTDIGLLTCRPEFRRGRDESVQSAHRHLPVSGNQAPARRAV